MTRIDLNFWLPDAPQRAQSWFVTDVVPALARVGGFEIDIVRPGYLVLSDRSADPPGFAGGDGMDYSLLSNCFPCRIRVVFQPETGGTKVAIKGRGSRKTRVAVEALIP